MIVLFEKMVLVLWNEFDDDDGGGDDDDDNDGLNDVHHVIDVDDDGDEKYSVLVIWFDDVEIQKIFYLDYPFFY